MNTIGFFRKLFMLVILIFQFGIMMAQVQVVSLVRPPYQNRLSEYSSKPELMVVTLMNTSEQVVNVQLIGSITGDNGVSVKVKDGFRSTGGPIVIGPNQTVHLNGYHVSALFEESNIESFGVDREYAARTLTLPEGNYTLCIRALDYNTNVPLSPEAPIGCTMFSISDLEPPRILTPMHEQNINHYGIRSIPITWTTPSSSPPGIQYNVRLVEMIAPRNPNDAVQSTPPLYEETVFAPMLLYGPAHPALIPGRQYALVVQAVDPTGKSFFRNKGFSEAIAFTYGGFLPAPVIINPSHGSEYFESQSLRFNWIMDEQFTPEDTYYNVQVFELADTTVGQPTPTIPLISQTVVNALTLRYDHKTMPDLYMGKMYRVYVTATSPSNADVFQYGGVSTPVDFKYSDNLFINTDSLLETTIKGRVMYRFKEDISGGNYPVANQEVYLSKIYGVVNIDEFGVSRIVSPPPYSNSMLQGETMMNGVSVMTDEDGYFELKIFMSVADSSGLVSDERWDDAVKFRRGGNPLIRRTKEQLMGKLGVYYKFKVNNPHFLESEEYLQINPGSLRDLSEVVVDANSYSLSVNVQEVFNGLKGDYVSGATVRIYRERIHKQNRTLGIPRYEGDIKTKGELRSNTSDDKILIAERITPELTDKKSAEQARVVFSNLFRNLPSDEYQYKIELVDGALVLAETSYSTSANAIEYSGSTKNVGAIFSNNTKINFNQLIKGAVIDNNGISSGNPKVGMNTTNNYVQSNLIGGNNRSNLVPGTFSGYTLDPSLSTQLGGPMWGGAYNSGNFITSKWLTYGYRDKPNVAFLTLEKELLTPPRSKVTGKLNYAFKNMKGIPEQPYANMRVKLMVFYEFQEARTTNIGNTSVQLPPVVVPGISYYDLQTGISTNTSGNIQSEYESLFINGKDVTDNHKVLQSVMTDAEGNFEFDFPNSEQNGSYQKGGIYTPNPVNNWVNNPTGWVRRVYRIVPDEPYYCAPDDNVFVQPWGSKDMGTLVSFVRTYNVEVKVTKVNHATNPTEETNFEHVPIALYRDMDNKAKVALPVVPGLDLNKRGVVLNPAIPNNASSGLSGSGSTSQQNQGLAIGQSGGLVSGMTPNVNSTFSGAILNNGALNNLYLNSVSRELYSYTKIRDSLYSEKKGNSTYVTFQNVVVTARKQGYKDNYVFHAKNGERDLVVFEELIFRQGISNNPKLSGEKNNTIIQGELNTILHKEIVFNSEFDPNKTLKYAIRLIPKPTLIKGRVKDCSTTLGVKGASVKAEVYIKTRGTHNNWYNREFSQYVTTDEYGYYSFESLSKQLGTLDPSQISFSKATTRTGKDNNVKITAVGYDGKVIKLDSIGAGLTGKQYFLEHCIEPKGMDVYGYVSDAETGEPVAARVKKKVNGTWVETIIVPITSHIIPGRNRGVDRPIATRYRSKFVIDLPARADSIIIEPFDSKYFTITAGVHPKKSGEYLGEFKLEKRKHRIRVEVKTTDGRPVPDAHVYIEGAGEDHIKTNSNGEALFKFVNNSTSHFNIYVRNSDGGYRIAREGGRTVEINPIPFIPTERLNFESIDDLVQRTAKITVTPAVKVKGTVRMDGKTPQPLEGALVYVDFGNGSKSESYTYTKAFGKYELLVPKRHLGGNITIKATYHSESATYIGDELTIQRPVNDIDGIDLKITEFKGIDITKLYGFDFHIEKLDESKGEFIVTGEVVQVEENANFALKTLADRRLALKVNDLRVRKSTILNDKRVPIAVPIDEKVTFVNKNIRIRAFEHYNADLSGESTNVGISMYRLTSDNTGTIRGKVKIVDNSFNFPTSYLTIKNDDFYLGSYGASASIPIVKRMAIDVFNSSDEPLPDKYALYKNGGQAIKFKYLGFDGESGLRGQRESFMDIQGAHLFLTLKPKIQGGITLSMEAGKALIRHDGIDPITDTGKVTIDIEKWKLESNKWTLAPNSGGIVLEENKLFTGRIDIALPKVYIRPGELIFDKTDKINDFKDNLYLGGSAKVKLNIEDPNNTSVILVYDPKVGSDMKGHFKFTLMNSKQSVASVKNLKYMRPDEKFQLQYISVLSNDEEFVSFQNNAPPVTLFKQMSFRPITLFSTTDRVVFTGATNLHMPHVPNNISMSLTYYSDRAHVSDLNFSFISDGGTKFETVTGKQKIDYRGALGITGKITLPGSNQKFDANLVSVVYDKINNQASSVTKQTEVILGDYLGEAGSYLANLVDVVSIGIKSNLRKEIVDSLENVRSTFGQVMNMAESGSQQLKLLGGNMRLLGAGITNATHTYQEILNGNPIGSMMQINGIMQGVTGVSIVDEAKQKVKQVGLQVVKAAMDELPVDNLADELVGGDGFAGSKFDFDFRTGAVRGELSMPILTAGVATFNNIQLSMLFDPKGWYFYASANIHAPAPIFPLDVGIGIGNYPTITTELENLMVSQSYVKKLPQTFYNNGLTGFLITGRRDLIPETSVRFGMEDWGTYLLGIPDVEVGLMAGLDARIYGNFTSRHQQISIGAMLFAHAYAKVTAIGCTIRGEAKVEVGAKATVTNSADSGASVDVRGCFSAYVAAGLQCGPLNESLSLGVMGEMTFCVGNCNSTFEFFFTKGAGSCSNSSNFDY